MALLSGISEANILEVKQTEIHERASQSIKSKGWLPNLFRGIVAKAKDFLQNLIREKDMPPKPTLDIDMAEFRHMRNLMIKVQDKARKIKNLQDKVLPQLKQQLADTKGLFKGKERKALETKIRETEAEIADRLDKIPIHSKRTVTPMYKFLCVLSEKWKALWNSTTVTLLSGNIKSAGNRQPPLKNSTERLKNRAC